MLNVLALIYIICGCLACCYGFYLIFRQIKEQKPDKSLDAAYIRSTIWYKRILELPVEQRAMQFDDWKSYTLKLPTRAEPFISSINNEDTKTATKKSQSK